MVYTADQCFLGNASQDIRLRSGNSVNYGHLIMKSAGFQGLFEGGKRVNVWHGDVSALQAGSAE